MTSGLSSARKTPALLLAAALAGLTTSAVIADSIVLFSVKDNTLINNPAQEYSNGAGDSIYAGRTGQLGGEEQLRAVLKFDLSAIPPGSVISGASLALYQVATVSGGQEMTLHRMLADWGEGASAFPGGAGVPAQPSDATWNYRFFPTQIWTHPGGDFDPLPSAAAICDFSGVDYTWAGPPMTTDVQRWVNDPCANFGWILIGNEIETLTAKRFASREWTDDPQARPRLSITYTSAAVCAGDVNHNHVVDIDDLVGVITTWGSCSQPCGCPGDQNHNSTVDIDDLVIVITHWGACPAN